MKQATGRSYVFINVGMVRPLAASVCRYDYRGEGTGQSIGLQLCQTGKAGPPP
jgi:hypothetical protein